jgi:hypothetical protein
MGGMEADIVCVFGQEPYAWVSNTRKAPTLSPSEILDWDSGK